MEKTLVSTSERRLYTRLNKRIPVSIHYNNLCVSRCSTNNISVGGALLDVQDLGLIENALIEISFGVNQWHALYGVKIPAIVVWRNETQIAVSFEMLRKDTEELMRDHIDLILVEPREDQNHGTESKSLPYGLQSIFNNIPLAGFWRKSRVGHALNHRSILHDK